MSAPPNNPAAPPNPPPAPLGAPPMFPGRIIAVPHRPVARVPQGPVQPMAPAAKKSHIVLPPIAALTGTKRPFAQLEDEDEDRRNRGPIPRIRTTALTGAQATNPHTLYLETLLEYHRFRLSVTPWAAVNGPKPFSRIVTNAGLLLHTQIRKHTTIPVLPLPGLTRINGENIVMGPLDTTVRGRLLETIWSTLAPAAKYSYARQLRAIVTAMRSIPLPTRGERLLGSGSSGPYSIIIDKHQQRTYWVIRPRPTHGLFLSFLLSSTDSHVAGDVTVALASQFREEYGLVLTHGELAPRQVLVDEGKITAVLGWNIAGWYPEWWEYARFFETSTRDENKDWYEFAKEIFEVEYPAELAAYQGIKRSQQP